MRNLFVPNAQFAQCNATVGRASISVVTYLSVSVLMIAGTLGLVVSAKARLGGKGASPQVSTMTARAQKTAPATPQTQPDHARINANFAALPLAFEPNLGQTDPQVKYSVRGRRYSLFLTSNAAYFALPLASKSTTRQNAVNPANTRGLRGRALAAHEQHNAVTSVRMNILGSNINPEITGENQLPGVSNYILGRDLSKWRSGIAHYGQIRYHNIYPGVDLAFHGASQREDEFEFDFLINPGVKPEAVSLEFTGLKGLRTTVSGDLVLASVGGDLNLHRPFAYQEEEGIRQPVDARFVIHANNRVSFALGNYDHSRQVVIDPTVTYSTYLGGSAEDDGYALTVDGSGNTYIAGETESTNFTGATGAPVGTFDVFVTKFNPSGTLLFTTLVGGSMEDVGFGVAVDGTGIYVAGETFSSDFPATTGQTAFLAGSNHGFLFKLTSTGSALIWSTLIEGTGGDSALALAVDSSQDVYVVGATFSTDLGGGTVNALPGGSSLNNNAGANGDDDGFIAKVKNDGSQYLFLSYLGGTNIDSAQGVALDGAGNVYVAGFTNSPDFPAQPGAFQLTCGTDGQCNPSGTNPQDDAFVVAISASDAPAYIYSTYLGGEKADEAFAIAVDSAGNAYVTGQTRSTSFPTKNPVTGLSALLGSPNAFVASLNPVGAALNYSTYLGGSGSEAGFGIAVDGNDDAYVTGYTTSQTTFPTVAATQSTFGGGNSASGNFDTDAFVSELNLNGASLSLPFSTYLGGKGDEDFLFGAIAVDSSGKVYVTGNTNSSNFPLANAVDGTYNGGSNGNCMVAGVAQPIACPDAFVTVYAPNPGGDFSIAGTPLAAVSPGGSSTSTITITPFNGYNQTVTFTCTVSGGGTPAPQCANPSSVPGGSGTTTLTVTTTAATAMLVRPGSRRGAIFFASLLPIAGFALLGLASAPAAGKKRLAAFLCLFLLLSGLLVLPACGGASSSGGGGGGGGSAGTPAGTYTITVTGTDGTITHSIAPALTLTVN